MRLFDIKSQKKRTLTTAQKNRQKHAIWNYYKKKNKNLTSNSSKK